jgi:dipeptidyl aminopeptidase/acylaminoacyl peptidase
MVSGDIDNNVHPGNTLRVVDALVKANKRFDFMMLPGQRHGYGNETAYFDRMMWYYFAEHLLGDYRTNVGLTDF